MCLWGLSVHRPDAARGPHRAGVGQEDGERDLLTPPRQVLESFKIMDYSLLLGVHNIDQQERERQAEGAQSTADEKRPLGQKALYSTAMESIQGGAARGEAIESDDT